MKKIYASLVCIAIGFAAFSQVPSKSTIQNPSDRYADWIEFSESNAPAFKPNQVFLLDETNKSTYSSSLKNVSKETDQLGFVHYRVQQTINNFPVENAEYVLHVKNARLMSQNGKWLKKISSTMATSASLPENTALNKALQFIGASSYKWQDAEEEAFIKADTKNPLATYYPKGSLVYYSGENDVLSSSMRLAYKFDIYASAPVSRKIVFVDAVNGTILGSRELLHETNATGTAVTAYSGTQTITSDLYNGSYRLREIGRGNGVETYNMKKGTSTARAVDFTDADNNWNNVNTTKDQYATDAHWGAEMTYDFYKNNFSRNSIDGNGFALKSYVHYSSNYFNAFWDGTKMVYGDGSSLDGFKPLTALDVCGHEITHGLTSFTAKLVYSYESGALNEGFSDIFGTSIEWYARPAKKDWLVGADFYTIRSMSNPNAYNQPDTYLGTKWYTSSSDNGGVHTNSGVLNFWYYLLTDGGNGTNDKGFVYSVTGLGMAKSQAIAFRALTVYLISTSKYADARTATIKAAQDLYGVGSNEETQTVNAWNAVGVGGGTAPAFASNNGATSRFSSFTDNSILSTSYSISPNPVFDIAYLQINSLTAGTQEITVLDQTGRIVLRKFVAYTKGMNNINIDLSTLPTSLYLIRIGREKTLTIFKK